MSRFPRFSIALLLLTASCALSQDIHYNFDKTADFSKFKRYVSVTLKNAAPVDDLTDKQIKAALNAALAQKGLTKIDGDTADLFVGYQAAVSTEQQYSLQHGLGLWSRLVRRRVVRSKRWNHQRTNIDDL